MVKNELGQKIMAEFNTLSAKMHAYKQTDRPEVHHIYRKLGNTAKRV